MLYRLSSLPLFTVISHAVEILLGTNDLRIVPVHRSLGYFVFGLTLHFHRCVELLWLFIAFVFGLMYTPHIHFYASDCSSAVWT